MSVLKVDELQPRTSGNRITLPDVNNYPPYRNLIINGDMSIDQRNNGGAITPTGSVYTVDRWQANIDVASKLSFQQSTTAPTGFINSILITSLSSYSVGSGEQFNIQQRIEGSNIVNLSWGSASAKTITFSFWVRSSLTGTFGGSLRNSAQNRSYPFTYNISSADTWEQKSVTVIGDTTGTWLTTNGNGIIISFSMGAGSGRVATAGTWIGADRRGATGQTNLVATNGANFYLTGVQLEVGTSATPFEFLPYDVNLHRCQRYFQKIGGTNTNDVFATGFTTTNTFFGVGKLNKTMRTSPSASLSGTNSHINYTIVGVAASANAAPSFTTNIDSFFISVTSGTGTTNYAGAYIRILDTSTSLHFDSEL